MGEPAWGWAEDDWGEPPARRSLAAWAARLARDHALSLTLGVIGAGLLPYRSGVGAALLVASISLEYGRTDLDSAWRLGRTDDDRTRGRLSAGIYLATGLSRAGVAAFIGTAAMTILAPLGHFAAGDRPVKFWSASPEVLGTLSLCCFFFLASWSITVGTIAACFRHGKRIQLVEPPRKPGSSLAPKRLSGREPSAAVKITDSLILPLGGVTFFIGPIGILCVASGVFDGTWSVIPVVNQPPCEMLEWIGRNFILFVGVCVVSGVLLFGTSVAIMSMLLQMILPEPPAWPLTHPAEDSIRIVASLAPDCQIKL